MGWFLVALCSMGAVGGTEPTANESDAGTGALGSSSSAGTGSREVSFEPPRSYAVGIAPEIVVAGDLDGDADPEMVVAHSRETVLGYSINQRDGESTPARFLRLKIPADLVDLVDIDQDRDLDLVTTSNSFQRPRDHIWVVLNEDGKGSFGKHRKYPVGDGPECIVCADLNGDGRKDLAVANDDSAEISILIGDGQGGFLPARNIQLQEATAPGAVVAADFDRDGDVDLATISNSDNDSDYGVVVLDNKGKALFGEPALYAIEGGPNDLIAADLDGDGDVDLATANLGEEGGPRYTYEISVLLNTGRGTFSAPRNCQFGGGGASYLKAADLDLDGDIDLVVTPSETNAKSFFVLLNDGDATFSRGRAFFAGHELSSEDGVSVADVDGDGDADVLVPYAYSRSIVVFLNATRGGAPGE